MIARIWAPPPARECSECRRCRSQCWDCSVGAWQVWDMPSRS